LGGEALAKVFDPSKSQVNMQDILRAEYEDGFDGQRHIW